MSKEVDERVVEMKFDNKDFEKNTRKTMSTLDSLKKKLNMSKASDGLKSVADNAKRISFDHLESSVDTISKRFTNLGIIGVTALQNITNAAMNTGKRLISAVTIDPIKDGLAEYETQMNAVQTILANTQKEGTNVKIVNAALDDLNHYADKTIYNFTEMTRNIGTFTAAGVKLNDSVSAIKGIANLAAMSGSSSTQASTAMYQLSQALAAGKVQLMDWNSVVNAGMGGQVFQDALIRTSEHLKTGAKQAIKANGSFRESLTKTGWLTTEVLTQTLDQFATAADTEEEYNAAIKKFVSQGYSQEQAKQIADMARTAGDAATKVKTFTQLIDTLKEALGSGWTETWRTVIGDFEEAKEMWTKVSDVLGGMINESSDARNAMLKEWADQGGRDKLIKSFSNAFKGLASIVKPVKEAFRDIFPHTTSAQLLAATDNLQKLTAKFKIGDDTAQDLKNTFKGLFAIVRMGIDIFRALVKMAMPVVSVLSSVGKVVLSITGAFGDWTSTFDITVDKTEKYNEALQSLKDKLHGAGEGVIELTRVLEPLKGLLSLIGDGFDYVVEHASFDGIVTVVKTALSGGLAVAVIKFIKSLTGAVDHFTGFGDNIKEVLEGVKESLEEFQNQLKSKTLITIAIAIGILAASLVLLSTIDKDSVEDTMGMMTGLMIEALAMLAAVNKISSMGKRSVKSISTMIGISVAIGILALALKALSTIDGDKIATSMVAVTVLLTELVAIVAVLSKLKGKMTKGVGALKSLAVSVLILALAIKMLGSMDIASLGKGLGSVAVLLAELVGFMALMRLSGMSAKDAAIILVLANAMVILSAAVSVLGRMNTEQLVAGVSALAGVLAILTAFMKFNDLQKNMLACAAGLLIISAAVAILSGALAVIGSMPVENITMGLLGLASTIAILVVALQVINGSIAGAAALFVVAAALAVLAPSLALLGSLGIIKIAEGLVALAGAFAIIGIAGAVLGPIAPSIMLFGAALAVIGAGLLVLGGGIAVIGGGLTFLASGFSALAAIDMIGLAVGIAGLTAELALFSAATLVMTPALVIFGAALVVFSAGCITTAAGISLLTAAMSLMNIGAVRSFASIEKSIDKVMVKFSKMETSVAKSCTKAMNSAIKAVNGKKRQFVSAGKASVDGYINGMNSRRSNVYKAASSIAQTAVNAMKRQLDIHSPSRVFGKLAALSIAGYTNGFDNSRSDIYDSVSGTIGHVMDRLNDLVENGSDSMNSMSPTITPVMDMSAVQSNISAMNAMLSRDQAVAIQNGMKAKEDSLEIDDGKITVEGTIRVEGVNDDDELVGITDIVYDKIVRKIKREVRMA